MSIDNMLSEAQAAEWLREPVSRLEQWRRDDAGPDFTLLRDGRALYELRTLKIYLREQKVLRKAKD